MRAIRRRQLLIILLLAAALALGQTGVVDWEEIHRTIEPISGRWWAFPLIVAMQGILYALALPGSAFLIVVPLFYPPALSTALVVAGGAIGALLGYLLAKAFGAGWRGELEGRRSFRLLKRNSDFSALCAMRLFPGFPHSVINYGSGLLRLPLRSFLLATALGFAAKGYLYAVLVYRAVQAEDIDEYIRLESLWPLVVLAALLVAGRVVQRRWSAGE